MIIFCTRIYCQVKRIVLIKRDSFINGKISNKNEKPKYKEQQKNTEINETKETDLDRIMIERFMYIK